MLYKLTLTSIFFFWCLTAISQDKYDQEIKKVSTQLKDQLSIYSEKAKHTRPLKIALVGITNENDQETKLTALLEDELVVNLANASDEKYEVLDRNYIMKIIQEKNIPRDFRNRRDFARNLGRFKAADLMIVGKLTNADNEYRIIFSFLETTEGITVGGVVSTLTATDMIRKKNEELITQPKDQSVSTVSENKEHKDPKEELFNNTTYSDNNDPGCATDNMGSLTIENWTNYKIGINLATVSGYSAGNITIEKKEKTTILQLYEGRYTYTVDKSISNQSFGLSWESYSSGMFSIIKCKDLKIIIK